MAFQVDGGDSSGPVGEENVIRDCAPAAYS
jgi:hypothetical protein